MAERTRLPFGDLRLHGEAGQVALLPAKPHRHGDHRHRTICRFLGEDVWNQSDRGSENVVYVAYMILLETGKVR